MKATSDMIAKGFMLATVFNESCYKTLRNTFDCVHVCFSLYIYYYL